METVNITIQELNETINVSTTEETVNITVDETVDLVSISSSSGDEVSVNVESSIDTVTILDESTIEDININIAETSEIVEILVGEVLKTWINYVTEYEPSTETNIVGGTVIQMNNLSETLYRFVPEPYDYSEDKIYGAFDGSNLTNLITKRI